MDSSTPGPRVGYTGAQRAAIRAVEEEAVLELVDDTVKRLNRIGNRLDALLGEPSSKVRPREER